MSSVIAQTGATETVMVGPIVDVNGNPLTGLTSIKAAIIRASDRHFLDWSTLGFTATPTTEYQALTELDSARAPGVYYLSVNTSTFVGTNAADRYFVYISQQGASSAVNALQMGELRVGTVVDKVEANLNGHVAMYSGTASGGSSGSITLTGGNSADNYFRWMTVAIVGGTGAGQARVIASYVGSTKVATVHRPWTVAPDSTSVFEITVGAQPDLLEIGLAQGGTSTTIQLISSSSSTDNLYVGNSIAITSGTGVGQERSITGYVGATTTVTVDEAWVTTPDATSVYVMTFGRARVGSVASAAVTTIQSGLATSGGLTSLQAHGDSAWATVTGSALLGTSLAGITGRTTLGGALVYLRKMASNRLAETDGSPGTLVLYDDDGVTVLGTYNLTDISGAAVSTPAGQPARRTAVTP